VPRRLTTNKGIAKTSKLTGADKGDDMPRDRLGLLRQDYKHSNKEGSIWGLTTDPLKKAHVDAPIRYTFRH
jgi:hypothetical protein